MKKGKKKSTNRATEFSKDLARSLEKHVRFDRKFAGLKWKKNWHPHEDSAETVDVAGLDEHDNPVVLIEAELLREDPA